MAIGNALLYIILSEFINFMNSKYEFFLFEDMFLIISGKTFNTFIFNSELWGEDLNNLTTNSNKSDSVNSKPIKLDISPKEEAKGNFIFSSFSFAIKVKHGFNFSQEFFPKNIKTAGKL